MRRILSTSSATAALVAGVGLTLIATGGPASVAGWCDGSKGIPLRTPNEMIFEVVGSLRGR
ncbi:hypothetical protein GCM10022245_24110 [Streptomyces mayteni]